MEQGAAEERRLRDLGIFDSESASELSDADEVILPSTGEVVTSPNSSLSRLAPQEREKKHAQEVLNTEQKTKY